MPAGSALGVLVATLHEDASFGQGHIEQMRPQPSHQYHSSGWRFPLGAERSRRAFVPHWRQYATHTRRPNTGCALRTRYDRTWSDSVILTLECNGRWGT